MDFKEYQKESRKTAMYPNVNDNYIYPTLGLAGEAGEIANKVKKIMRDEGGVVTEDKKQELSKEFGDVLWYISQLASEFELSLSEIANLNIEKLQSRKQRGKIHGDGDNR